MKYPTKEEKIHTDNLKPAEYFAGGKQVGKKERFENLIKKDRTLKTDRERLALFLILASSEDLYSKAETIYNFSDRCINPDCFDQVDLSGGLEEMVKLGFNLFNGYPANVLDVFSRLDEDNFEVAIKAIRARFSQVLKA